MGYPIEYGEAKEIFKEIKGLIPGYGLLGPAPTPPRPDQAVVESYLKTGYSGDLADRYALPGAGEKDGSLTLMVGQTLFHSGKFSTRAKGLLQVQNQGALSLNPADGTRLGLAEGDRVRVSNDLGEMTTILKLADRVPAGMAFFPEHFDQDARRLLSVSIDPATKVPYYKSAQVTIEKAIG
jgi:formate dehydrogenase alpha subunit